VSFADPYLLETRGGSQISPDWSTSRIEAEFWRCVRGTGSLLASLAKQLPTTPFIGTSASSLWTFLIISEKRIKSLVVCTTVATAGDVRTDASWSIWEGLTVRHAGRGFLWLTQPGQSWTDWPGCLHRDVL